MPSWGWAKTIDVVASRTGTDSWLRQLQDTRSTRISFLGQTVCWRSHGQWSKGCPSQLRRIRWWILGPRCSQGKLDSDHFRPRRRILAIDRSQIPVLGVRSGGPIGKLVGRRSKAADHLVEAIE